MFFYFLFAHLSLFEETLNGGSLSLGEKTEMQNFRERLYTLQKVMCYTVALHFVVGAILVFRAVASVDLGWTALRFLVKSVVKS